jgi:hypothetical protein
MFAKNVNTHAHGDVHLVVLAHLQRRWSLSGRDGVGSSVGFSYFSEVFFTVFIYRTLALGAPVYPVSSGRSTREGAERADTGQGAPARPISFYGGPDAADQTLVEHCSASGHADVAVRSEVREDRTLACVHSTFLRSGPLLETTRHHVDQRPVISICASNVACTRAL